MKRGLTLALPSAILLPLLAMLFCTSCEDVVECAWAERIALAPENAHDAVVGEPYHLRVSASVKNHPFDDIFDYNFLIDEDDLPPGLEARAHSDRDFDISGVPQVAGRYEFTVHVFSHALERRDEREVDEERDRGDILISSCIDSDDERTYIITIHE